MQNMRKDLNDKDILSLKRLILSKDKEFHITLTTFKRNLHDILNTATYTESNDCLKEAN